MSSSMYEVFNWTSTSECPRKLTFSLAGSGINIDEPPTAAEYQPAAARNYASGKGKAILLAYACVFFTAHHEEHLSPSTFFFLRLFFASFFVSKFRFLFGVHLVFDFILSNQFLASFLYFCTLLSLWFSNNFYLICTVSLFKTLYLFSALLYKYALISDSFR